MLFILYKLSEIFDSVERRIIGVVKAVCSVHSRSAKEDQIVAFKHHVNVLKTNLFMILISIIKNIVSNSPIKAIIRYQK